MGKSTLLRITEETGSVFQTLAEAVGSIKDSFDPRVLGPIVTEATGKPGSKWAVVVIQEGTSLNRVHYSADVLKRATPLYENARVFWNHDDKTMRDPRNLAGFIKEAALGTTPDGKTAITGVLVATSPKLREMLIEAHEAGNPNLFGLSHTVAAETERVMLADGPAVRAKSIKAVESVDVVSFPSAGGRVMRLAAGSNSPVMETQEGLAMLEKKLTKLKESRPDLFAKLGATPTEAEVDALLLEGIVAAPAAKTPEAPKAAGLSDADRSLLTEAKVNKLMEGRTLPDESKAVIREGLIALANAGAADEILTKNLDAHVAAAAKIAEAKPTGAGHDIKITKDEATKILEAVDGFFQGNDKGFKSFKDLYQTVTGDKGMSGKVTEAVGLRKFERLLESLNSSSFSNLISTAINRKMVADYNAKTGPYTDTGEGWLWEAVPLDNLKTQVRARYGGYGNLVAVAEGTAYPVMTSPTDEKATYTPAKYGGTEQITWEMVINDDVGAIRRIPQKIAMSARRTLYEFVYAFLTTNPTIYDSVALFHANHGSNLVTTALSATSYKVARLAMLKQAEKDSSKRLGLLLQHLIIPSDLEETARNLFRVTTENEKQFIQAEGAAKIHIMTHATDATDWFACAGIDQTPQIEIGFLNGNKEPEIWVQDDPRVGNMFLADAMDFKVRHTYGGVVMDYRGLYGAYGVS